MPRGVPISVLRQVELNLDEFEALRLVDYLNMQQMKAAKSMEISQPTLNRILASGRKKVAQCIVEGYTLRIKMDDITISRIFNKDQNANIRRRIRGAIK